ncbi:thioredoxin family protein [Streptomyces sp. SID10815]|uniref:thioredoxin family protein n=1 Tax=Streptomyces sp. SID10815 TaxID=2706027 RepID=UPI0013C64D72|nr:thioredoxin family protein [Streptomyces sp. SID10815]NEA47013.1 thioredoxin family protein [Streptomyces sp. SID10815]
MSDAPGVSEVTDADFARQVLAAELPVLVEFTADWCPPCRQMGPVLGALAAEEAGRLKVVQLNVDRNPDITNAYKVLSMPTFLVFRDGEPVRSMVGARAKRRLLAELADVLPREAAPPGAVTS